MKASATEAEIQAVVGIVEKLDYSAHIIRGVERTVVACVGEERGEQHQLGYLRRAGVDRVICCSFKLAAARSAPRPSTSPGRNRRPAVARSPGRAVERGAVSYRGSGRRQAQLWRGGAFHRAPRYSFRG
jgi:hypothetical protein